MTPVDFGRMLTVGEVERRVLAHLQAWMPTALRAVERNEGLNPGDLGTVRSWDRSSEFDTFDEAVPPNVLVVSPGMVGKPVIDGDGVYRATFEVVLGALVESTTSPKARDLSSRYATALALAMTRPGIEGLHGLPEWQGMEFDVIPFEDTRTLAAARVPFEVEFVDVLETAVGPLVPLVVPEELPPDPIDVTGSDVSVIDEWEGDTS